jgi:hypothetical protein
MPTKLSLCELNVVVRCCDRRVINLLFRPKSSTFISMYCSIKIFPILTQIYAFQVNSATSQVLKGTALYHSPHACDMTGT